MYLFSKRYRARSLEDCNFTRKKQISTTKKFFIHPQASWHKSIYRVWRGSKPQYVTLYRLQWRRKNNLHSKRRSLT